MTSREPAGASSSRSPLASRRGPESARPTWEQETEDKPVYRGTIRATRGQTSGGGDCSEGWNLSYSARLADLAGADKAFEILDGEGGGAAGYDEAGSGRYTLTPCEGLPGCSADLILPPGVPSHGSVLFSADGDTVSVEADALFDGGDCQFNSVTLGLGEFPRSLIGDDTITVPLSFNGAPVFGNGTLTLTRAP